MMHKHMHSVKCHYIYEVCVKSFRQQSNLEIHQYINSELPYTCDVCNMAFRLKCAFGNTSTNA
jgi:hypothetical protein